MSVGGEPTSPPRIGEGTVAASGERRAHSPRLMTAPPTIQCDYTRTTVVQPHELTGDDIGALEPDEVGFVAHCTCGEKSRIRYSPIAAQSEIAEHILGVVYGAPVR